MTIINLSRVLQQPPSAYSIGVRNGGGGEWANFYSPHKVTDDVFSTRATLTVMSLLQVTATRRRKRLQAEHLPFYSAGSEFRYLWFCWQVSACFSDVFSTICY